MAEFYHIYNYEDYSADYIAILVSGLGETSRTMKKITGTQFSLEEYLLAMIADDFNLWLFSHSKHAETGKMPKSLVAILTGKGTKKTDDTVAFRTPDDFEKARQALLDA